MGACAMLNRRREGENRINDQMRVQIEEQAAPKVAESGRALLLLLCDAAQPPPHRGGWLDCCSMVTRRLSLSRRWALMDQYINTHNTTL